MIVGIGADICDVARIAGALERQGDRFRNRILSERELEAARLSADDASFLAGRFAAKEACAKALGTGITERVRWRQIEIIPEQNGEPRLVLSEGARRRAARLAGGWVRVRAHLSITHDESLAMAFVLIESI